MADTSVADVSSVEVVGIVGGDESASADNGATIIALPYTSTMMACLIAGALRWKGADFLFWIAGHRAMPIAGQLKPIGVLSFAFFINGGYLQ